MLVHLLFHEMAVVAFANRGAGQRGEFDLARDLGAAGVAEDGAVAADHRPVAVAQIGDPPRQRRQRQAVGADEHLVVAEADGQRRAVAGADHQFGVAGEHHGQRISPLQAA